MDKASTIFVGIDVSKDEIVIAYKEQKGHTKFKTLVLKNTVEVISTWLSQLGVEGKWFILEHTGSYSQRLIYALHTQGASFSVINGSESRHTAKSLSKTHKNDYEDAKTLCFYGESRDVYAYKMLDTEQKRVKDLLTALTSLEKQAQGVKNQIHALSYHVVLDADILELYKTNLSHLEKQIQQIEDKISPKLGDTEVKQRIEVITSIKSVGIRTALCCVARHGDFKQFPTAKAFVKAIGLSPTENTSGSSVRGRNCISRRGDMVLRSHLFNCARNAIRNNPNLKAFYERLINNGKNKKKALVAVMHKIARIIYGVVTSGEEYSSNFIK